MLYQPYVLTVTHTNLLHIGIQYVYVATTQNNLYKINAKTGDVVKSRNIGVPFMGTDLGGEFSSTVLQGFSLMLDRL